jgi:hypothetical protein
MIWAYFFSFDGRRFVKQINATIKDGTTSFRADNDFCPAKGLSMNKGYILLPAPRPFWRGASDEHTGGM